MSTRKVFWFVMTAVVTVVLVTLFLLRGGGSAVRFTDVLEGSGIDFRHHFFPSEQGAEYRMNQYDHGSGVLVADVNLDGLPDVYLLDFLGPNGLYINRGGFRFENMARSAGVDMPASVSVGGAFGDYDGDGDPDLYVTTYRTGNRLFRNRGDGTFEDATAEAGLEHSGHSSAALWFDYDLDGDLDLYLSNIGRFTSDDVSPDAAYARRGMHLPLEDIMGHPAADHGGEPDILYRNDAGRFTDATQEVGLDSAQWNGDVTVADYDLDGWPDLYASNMFGSNNLFRNEGGKRFVSTTREALGRTSWGGMGALFFDANNDGRPDLYVVDMHSDMWTETDPTGQIDPLVKYDSPWGKRASNWRIISAPDQTRVDGFLFGNTFFVNLGEGRFEERSGAAGLENFWPWGIVASDFDNDGWQDLFVPAGMGYPYAYRPNHLLMNGGRGVFVERATAAGIEPPVRGREIEGLTIRGQTCARSSRSAAAADFDRDGDVDLVVNNFNHEPYLFRNDSPPRPFIDVRLQGRRSNRDGYGARVTVVTEKGSQYRESHSTGGYLTQSDSVLHFGLGEARRVDRVEVLWPGDPTPQIISSPAIDRILAIVQNE